MFCEEELLFQINAICKDGVAKFFQLMNTFGSPEELKHKWCDMFVSDIKKLMIQIYQHLEDQKKIMEKTIVELKKMATRICHESGFPPPVFTTCNNLYEEQSILTSFIKSLEEKFKAKQTEISLLRGREEVYCKSLGNTPHIQNQLPLPNAEEIEELLMYLDTLEKECFHREEKFTKAQTNLQELAKRLEYTPANEFEKTVLSEDVKIIPLHDTNMDLLNTFENEMNQRLQSIKTEAKGLMNEIQKLWNTLDIDECYREAFMKSHNRFDKAILEKLNMESIKLKKLKVENCGKLITQLKLKLQGLWEQSHINKSYRGEAFAHFNDTEFSDDLLTLFQNEATRLTAHYEENKILYENLLKYTESCTRLIELEIPPIPGTERYKNRGGQLLQEAKERKLIRKRLEKLEQQIIQLAYNYSQIKKQPFVYDGMSVECYMKNIYEDQKSHNKGETNLMKKYTRNKDNNYRPGSQFKINKGMVKSASSVNLNKHASNKNKRTLEAKTQSAHDLTLITDTTMPPLINDLTLDSASKVKPNNNITLRRRFNN